MIYSESIANIKLNGEKLEEILLKLGTGQDFPLLPYLFSRVHEVVGWAIGQLKEITHTLREI